MYVKDLKKILEQLDKEKEICFFDAYFTTIDEEPSSSEMSEVVLIKAGTKDKWNNKVYENDTYLIK